MKNYMHPEGDQFVPQPPDNNGDTMPGDVVLINWQERRALVVDDPLSGVTRQGHYVGVWRDLFVLYGGECDVERNVADSVHAFDVRQRAWLTEITVQDNASAPPPCSFGASGVIHNALYVVGGQRKWIADIVPCFRLVLDVSPAPLREQLCRHLLASDAFDAALSKLPLLLQTPLLALREARDTESEYLTKFDVC